LASRIRFVALLLLAALLFGVGLVPRVVAATLRSRMSIAAARYGARVSVGAVRLHWGSLELDGLRIDGGGSDPLLWAKHVVARLVMRELLVGHVHVDDVLIEQPDVFVVRGGPADNLTAVLDAFANRKPVEGGSRRLKLDTLRIADGKLEVRELGRGRVVVDSFSASVVPDEHVELDLLGVHLWSRIGATAEAEAVHLESGLAGRLPIGVPTLRITGGVLTPFIGLRLGAIGGEIGPDTSSPGRAKIALGGSYGDRTEKLWSANGGMDFSARQGRVTIAAERFHLDQLGKAMGGTKQGVVDTKRAEVDVRFDIGYAAQAVDFDGRVHLSGLTVENPRLGPKPVHDVGFDASLRGRADLAARSVSLESLKVDYRGVHATLVADVTKVGKQPSFHATAVIEPIACQRVLDALPAELTPFLQGFKVAGTFSTDLHAGLDLADLDTPIDLGGKVGIEGCKVTQSSSWGSAERLKQPFEHTVEFEPGKWMTFVAGPENPDFVPFAEISPHLINSIMTTEDSGFFKHHGFIASEFRSALQQNLQRGYFRLGASSITMQMVKNVLLSREKTLSRKLQEMFLTWYLERHLTKERILEIYFNVIEFGPGIYGIGRATHHYFGKSPMELTPRESVFFSSILPNPKRRYVQYCHQSGQVDAKWDNYLKRILKRMHERKRLTDAEYAEAIAAPLAFSRAEATSEHECMALVKRITGGPPWPSAK
jgi:hypothetical protein